MLRVTTNKKTGKSHAILTGPQRRRLAEAKSLCIELSLVTGDPRANVASAASDNLGDVLATEEPTDEPDDD